VPGIRIRYPAKNQYPSIPKSYEHVTNLLQVVTQPCPDLEWHLQALNRKSCAQLTAKMLPKIQTAN